MIGCFVTAGLHDADLEVEILIESYISNKEQSIKELNNNDYRDYHDVYLYKDKLVFKRNNLVIKKEETDKYQFRLCKVQKRIVSQDDYTDVTWDDVINYLIKDSVELPFILELYFIGVHEKHPFTSKN